MSWAGLCQRAGAFPLLATDADAPGHDDLLDVGGAAGVQGDDGRALVRLDVSFAGAPLRIFGQRGRAQDVQDAGGDA